MPSKAKPKTSPGTPVPRGRKRPQEEVLDAFFGLPQQDQYEVFDALEKHLDYGIGTETQARKELRERAEALAAVQAVAKHRQLPPGEAPGITEYENVRKELGLKLSGSIVQRRWYSWEQIRKAISGERIAETPHQLAHRRAVSGRKQSYEEWLTGVRIWLATRPPIMERTEYDKWAGYYNDQAGKSQQQVVKSAAIVRVLVLRWPEIVRVAKNEVGLQEAQEQHLEQLKATSGPLRLVGINVIALIHGVSSYQARYSVIEREGFPAAVAVVNPMKKTQAWYLCDIEAHHAGASFPDRTPYEAQSMIMLGSEVADLLGCSKRILNARLKRGSPLAPPVAGIVSACHYWLRTDVETWAKKHPDLIKGTFR